MLTQSPFPVFGCVPSKLDYSIFRERALDFSPGIFAHVIEQITFPCSVHSTHLCWAATSLFFKKIFIYLFIYFWLCWVFVSVRGLSLVAASGGHSSSRCAGLSLSRPLWLRSTGSRRAGSVVVVHGPSCSAACGIFPDQGSNPCPLHWQADSQPLRHQGSPHISFEVHILCYWLCETFSVQEVQEQGSWSHEACLLVEDGETDSKQENKV